MIFIPFWLRASALLFAFVGAVSIASEPSSAQQAPVRRIIQQAAPTYPVLARSLALQGAVKVSALVAADGTVKSVEVRGGHPVLVQAAANAVRRWKWEISTHDSVEQVEVKFAPE